MRNATLASILAGIGVCFSLFVPRAAQACWTCTTDSECPTGFTCDENIGCMPTVDCQADSDCGAGMRCVTQTATECTSTSGSSATTCHSINACAPIWQSGCASDSDCGDGFSCVENGSLCNSSGCTTLSQCQAKQPDPASCSTDSDCPSCWSCLAASVSGGSCENPGGVETGGASTSIPRVATDAGSPSSSSADAKVCRPPYWGLSVNYEGPPPSAPVNSSTSNLCPIIEATRAGATGLDPKSSASGSSGGCSIGSTGGSNDNAPLWSLGAALAGIAVFSRRKRDRTKS